MHSERLKILVAESNGFPARATEMLRQAGDVVYANLDRDGLLKAVTDTHVLWVRLRNRIDVEILDAAKRLKVIVSPTTGLNHIDMEEAERRGIKILSLRGESEFLNGVRATAEHTLALILMVLRNIPGAVAHVKGGGWNRDLFKGNDLQGKTVGIVGYGRLGRIVARYLLALDTRVLVADPQLSHDNVDARVTLLPLTQLLEKADIVTLHVDLRPETRNFFAAKEFSTMKTGAWFINTSRGQIVDEKALLSALRSGHLAGAALDVLVAENSAGMADHPLVVYSRDHDNLIITPHVGGCTFESLEKTEFFLAEKLCSESRLLFTN